MAKIIVQAYQNIINKYFPLKKLPKRVLKFISKPWFTRGIKVSIRNKNKLHAKLKKRYTEDAEIYFKRYRNILTKLKFKAFNKYYSDKAALAKKISANHGLLLMKLQSVKNGNTLKYGVFMTIMAGK